MMKKMVIPGAILGFVLLITLANALFTVNEREQALVLQFGDHIRTVSEPGLKFKVPFIQDVVRYERRLLDINVEADDLILGDQKVINADAYARYLIRDPLQFRRAVGDERLLRSRLETIIESTIRQVLGNKTLTAVLSEDRIAIMEEIESKVLQQSIDLGIQVEDVRIRRADLPEQTSQNIYRRMITEREREAKEFRAQGAEQAQQIRATADKERTVLLAEAKRDAEIMRGQGDGEAIKIYADAFNKDKNFYDFYRTLQAYRETLTSDDTTFVLSPNNDFLKFFERTN